MFVFGTQFRRKIQKVNKNVDLVSGYDISVPENSGGKHRQCIHIKYAGIGFIPLKGLTERQTA